MFSKHGRKIRLKLLRNMKNCFSVITKKLNSDGLNLKFEIHQNPKSISELPFILPSDRLHHIFASNFKGQLFCSAKFKDPFNEMTVNVMKTRIPFYNYEILVKNLTILKNKKTFKLPNFRLNFDNEEMQIFSGNYSLYSFDEILCAKILDVKEDVRQFSKPTSTKGQANKVYLKNENGMKVAISKFLEQLKNYCKNETKIDFENTTINGEIEAKFSLLYYPIYLLLFGYFGVTHRVFVNGVTGNSTGPKLLSFIRVALLIATISLFSILMLFPEYRSGDFLIEAVFISSLISFFVTTLSLISVVSKQFKVNQLKFEEQFKRFFETAKTIKKQNFYQNLFLFQNKKENDYHKWFRENSFEDFRRRNSKFDKFGNSRFGRKKFKNDESGRFGDFEKSVLDRHLYGILEINSKANQRQIEKSFKVLTLKWHPDKFANKSKKDQRMAETKFNDILMAYNVLRDSAKRRHYDLTGETDSKF